MEEQTESVQEHCDASVAARDDSGFKESGDKGAAILEMADVMTLLHDLVYVLAAVAFIFVFFVRIITVDGDSMLPTLQHRDSLLLLSNQLYAQPQHGDIVVARIPGAASAPIVKRVIAVEGDVVDVDFDSGIVSVNGIVLQEDYLLQGPSYEIDGQMVSFPLTVEDGCVFLMGDNRNASLDSRDVSIGPVDTRYILGKVIFLIFPGVNDETQSRDFSRIGAIG